MRAPGRGGSFVALVLLLPALLFWPVLFGAPPGDGARAVFPLVVASPVLVATWLGAREGESPFRRALLPRGRGWLWIAVALLCFPVLSLVSIACGGLLGEPAPRWPLEAGDLDRLWLAPLFLAIPCLAEEPGWRGYLQPRLERRLGPLGASIVVGLTWGAWHTSDLVMHPESFPDAASYLPKFAWIVGASLWFGWLHLRTGGNLLVAMAAHAGGNLAFALTPLSPWRGYPASVFQVHLALLFGGGLWLLLRVRGRAAGTPEP